MGGVVATNDDVTGYDYWRSQLWQRQKEGRTVTQLSIFCQFKGVGVGGVEKLVVANTVTSCGRHS